MDVAKLNRLKKNLNDVWTEDTCFPGLWNENKICMGQCEPTACVVQDLFGGDIYKIVGDNSIGSKGVHLFNIIEGNVVDLTAAQFDNPVAYEKGKKMEGSALRQLRTHRRYNRKQRYEILKRKVSLMMECPVDDVSNFCFEEKRKGVL